MILVPGAAKKKIGVYGLGATGVSAAEALVASGADAGVDRDLAQEGDPQLFGHPAPAAVAEDLGALAAVAADEVAHVLDHAQHRDVELAEHRHGLAHVGERDGLRRRHDHGGPSGITPQRQGSMVAGA